LALSLLPKPSGAHVITCWHFSDAQQELGINIEPLDSSQEVTILQGKHRFHAHLEQCKSHYFPSSTSFVNHIVRNNLVLS
jgi:hypothetical protein